MNPAFFWDPACARSRAMAHQVREIPDLAWVHVKSEDLLAHTGPLELPMPPAKACHAEQDTARWLAQGEFRGPERAPDLQRALEADVFALPTLIVEGRRYWGPERFESAMASLGTPLHTPQFEGELFHDFSSPYSYLGFMAVRDRGLALTPILLGALFRGIGTADVPLMTFPPARRAWAQWDLHEQARLRGVPFRFPSTFPLRTVTALRLALLEPSLTEPLYRAAWEHDRNLGDREVLKAILSEERAPEGLLERTDTCKQVLRQNTERAVRIGVPGAPTFLVDGQLYWGQDRLILL